MTKMSLGEDKEEEKRWVGVRANDAVGNLDFLVLVRFDLKMTQEHNLQRTTPIRTKSPQWGSVSETRACPLPFLSGPTRSRNQTDAAS